MPKTANPCSTDIAKNGAVVMFPQFPPKKNRVKSSGEKLFSVQLPAPKNYICFRLKLLRLLKTKDSSSKRLQTWRGILRISSTLQKNASESKKGYPKKTNVAKRKQYTPATCGPRLGVSLLSRRPLLRLSM